MHTTYASYRQSALKRDIEFSLTIEQFEKLTQKTCTYCGCKPATICNSKPNNSHGHFTYNGIDRVNNDIGYTYANCVTCCKTCNQMKSNRTILNFLDHIKNICKYQEELNGSNIKD